MDFFMTPRERWLVEALGPTCGKKNGEGATRRVDPLVIPSPLFFVLKGHVVHAAGFGGEGRAEIVVVLLLLLWLLLGTAALRRRGGGTAGLVSLNDEASESGAAPVRAGRASAQRDGRLQAP